MNKRFLNIAMAALLLGGSATGFVSCKDYDDDITEINANADGLSKQLDALQTALGQANEAAKAAAADAQRALEKGNQAEAAAALAKEAAATAKAEAIQAVIDQLKPLIDGKASQEDLVKLAGKIEGIEKSLNNIDLTDINKQLGDLKEQVKLIESINVEISALKAFKTALENANITEKVALIDGIVKRLGDLEKSVKANSDNIAAIQAELKAISAQISSEVSNAVNTIAGTMVNRLTSVTLIPELYVGGIPTIEFESAKYFKQVYKNNAWVNGTTEVSVTNNETSADYRLNPGTIKDEDIQIQNMAFVTRIATSRAAEAENDVVNVASASVGDNGILTVKLGKTKPASLNLSGKQIYTVSLKVPVATKHLFEDNGESQANIYSEFTRLAETYFKPELAFIKGKYYGDASHLYTDSMTLKNSQPGDDISLKLFYKGEHNLYDYVEGCKFIAPDGHSVLTRANLQKFGFDIQFHIVNFVYAPTEDKADQQKYVKLSGENNSVLTAIATSGATDNQVTVGKQPIIAATLFDKINNNIVEQKYFKVIFTPEDLKPIEINWEDIATEGKPCNGATFDFGWKEMSERVLEKLNENKGMSKEDFTKIYGQADPIIDPANDENGTLTPNIVAANLDASIPVMTWSLTPEQLGKLNVGDNKVVVTKKVTFTDPTGLHSNLTINLKWTVTTKVAATTLGKTDDLKWKNNTMKVYPVPMEIPYNGTQKAEYMTNILEGRFKDYVNGMLSCGYFDINYAKTGNPAYVGEALILPNGFTHWGFTAANQKNLDEIGYTIAHTAAGEKLVSNGGTIKIDWSSNINGMNGENGEPNNRYVFGSTYLQIVKILTINTELGVKITDNSRTQTIENIGKYLTLTDAYGNLVAEEPTVDDEYAADYYAYYGVEAPVFGKTIKIADDAAGTKNVRTLESLNMTADIDSTTGDLTFQNNGSPLQADAFIIVPVSVKHYWGTLEANIAIPLLKSSAPLNAPKK